MGLVGCTPASWLPWRAVPLCAGTCGAALLLRCGGGWGAGKLIGGYGCTVGSQDGWSDTPTPWLPWRAVPLRAGTCGAALLLRCGGGWGAGTLRGGYGCTVGSHEGRLDISGTPRAPETPGASPTRVPLRGGATPKTTWPPGSSSPWLLWRAVPLCAGTCGAALLLRCGGGWGAGKLRGR